MKSAQARLSMLMAGIASGTLLLGAVSSCSNKPKVPEGTSAEQQGEKPGKPEHAELTGPALNGWMGRMGSSPAEFTKLIQSSDGWNALWEADLGAAEEAFRASLAESAPEQQASHKIGLARTLFEMASFHETLFRSMQDLILRYLDERKQRRDKIGPETPIERYYGALVKILPERAAPAAEVVEILRQLSSDQTAGVYSGMARAWLGLALHRQGDAAAAETAWKDAESGPDRDPNIALLVAYTRARAGLWKEDATVPEGDGSEQARRLRFAVLVRSGRYEQARGELGSLQFRTPDHSYRLTLPAPVEDSQPAGAADSLEEEKTNLDFHAPFALQELANLRYREAVLLLEGGPACSSYWKGRALEALGEQAPALVAYQAVSAAQPEVGEISIPCLVMDVHGTPSELAEEAAIRSALLQGNAPEPNPNSGWANKLILAREKARRSADKARLMEQVAFLPEDPRQLETALEQAFEKKATEVGLNTLYRGRFFEHHVHDLYRIKAEVATLCGERRLAVMVMESLHDNTQQDDFTTLNRPGFLLESAMVRWQANDPQGAAVLLNVLWKRYPEVWPTSEFVRRIRAFQALDNIKSGSVIEGK